MRRTVSTPATTSTGVPSGRGAASRESCRWPCRTGRAPEGHGSAPASARKPGHASTAGWSHWMTPSSCIGRRQQRRHGLRGRGRQEVRARRDAGPARVSLCQTLSKRCFSTRWSVLPARPDQRRHDQQRRGGHHLAAEDHPVEVERRLPGGLAVPDDEHAERRRRQADAAAGTAALPALPPVPASPPIPPVPVPPPAPPATLATGSTIDPSWVIGVPKTRLAVAPSTMSRRASSSLVSFCAVVILCPPRSRRCRPFHVPPSGRATSRTPPRRWAASGRSGRRRRFAVRPNASSSSSRSCLTRASAKTMPRPVQLLRAAARPRRAR